MFNTSRREPVQPPLSRQDRLTRFSLVVEASERRGSDRDPLVMKQDVGGGQSRGASQGGRAATRTSPDIAGRSKRGLADLPLDTSPLSSFVALEDALPSIKTSIPTGLTSALAEYSPTEASPTTEGAQQEAGPNRFLRRFLHRHVHDGEVSEGEEDERSDKDAAKMPRRRGVCKFFNAQKVSRHTSSDYGREDALKRRSADLDPPAGIRLRTRRLRR